MRFLNHSREFKSDAGACTNEAESWFSRLRRAEMGVPRAECGAADDPAARRQRTIVHADELGAWDALHASYPMMRVSVSTLPSHRSRKEPVPRTGSPGCPMHSAEIPTAAHRALRGDLTRATLDALRDAPGPMTTIELARHVMAERGLEHGGQGARYSCSYAAPARCSTGRISAASYDRSRTRNTDGSIFGKSPYSYPAALPRGELVCRANCD